MPKPTEGNKWLARTAKYMREKGEEVSIQHRRGGFHPKNSLPVIGDCNGIYISILDKNMNPIARAPSTVAWMKREGFDPDGATLVEQTQFSHKVSSKCIKDVVAACISTQEEASTMWVEHHAAPVLLVVKAYPVGDQIFVVCVDVTKMGTVLANDFGGKLEAFFPNVNTNI